MVKDQDILRNTILKVIEYLGRNYELEAVVLFGSYASRSPHEFSDIDLAVISRDFDNKTLEEKASLFSEIKLNCDFDVEVHLFGASDLEQARPTNLLGQILADGTYYVKDRWLVA